MAVELSFREESGELRLQVADGKTMLDLILLNRQEAADLTTASALDLIKDRTRRGYEYAQELEAAGYDAIKGEMRCGKVYLQTLSFRF